MKYLLTSTNLNYDICYIVCIC